MKYNQILLLDEMFLLGVGNKGQAYEDDPRSSGCSFKNASRWRLHERDVIRRAAAQDRTKTSFSASTRHRARQAAFLQWRRYSFAFSS